MNSRDKPYHRTPDFDSKAKDKPSSSRLGATTGHIVAQLRNKIMEGQYAHEERLPAERHLAEEYDVSRGTIRSALQALEDQKLVIRQVGSGTYVTLPETIHQHEISSVTSPLEMVEVRIAVEPQMVRLAVINASHRDLEALHKAVQECEGCGGDAEIFARADTAFHMALAQCSKNKLLIWIYERISEVRDYSLWRSMKSKLLTQERIDYYNKQHRDLYKAIESRDANEAVSIIRKHLYGVQDDLLDT